MAADNVVRCLARLDGLVWQKESAGGRMLMNRGQLAGWRWAARWFVDAGKEQRQLQPANGWGRLVGEVGDGEDDD